MKQQTDSRLQQIEQTFATLSPRQMRWKMRLWRLTIKLSHKVKRTFDILVATLLLILLAPLFMVTAIAIICENPGPVFYCQTRVGKDGRPFRFF